MNNQRARMPDVGKKRSELKYIKILTGVIAVCLIFSSALLLVRGLRDRTIIFVGIDGADWRVINPLIEAGKMPNIARIVKEGSSGVLLAPEGYINSPPSWTSIATGKKVENHGVTYNVVPRDQIKATPFWEAAIAFGKRICCINWICTYKSRVPEGSVHISGPYKVSISPPGIGKRINSVVEKYQNDVIPRQVSLEFLNSAKEIEAERAAVAMEFLKDDYDIFTVTFTGTDR
ncbi:alkaline phosphatase family protein, partial [bacterium]|nr:alkaline phosphatase family protein [bacterium]